MHCAVAVDSLFRLQGAFTQPTGMLQPNVYILFLLPGYGSHRNLVIGRKLNRKDASYRPEASVLYLIDFTTG
jgi:hypothetical protein